MQCQFVPFFIVFKGHCDLCPRHIDRFTMQQVESCTWQLLRRGKELLRQLLKSVQIGDGSCWKTPGPCSTADNHAGLAFDTAPGSPSTITVVRGKWKDLPSIVRLATLFL